MSELKPWTHYVQYMYMYKSRSMYFFSTSKLFAAAFLFVTLFENLITYSSTLAAARKTTQKYVDIYAAIRLKYEIYILYTYVDDSLTTFFSNSRVLFSFDSQNTGPKYSALGAYRPSVECLRRRVRVN